MYSKKLKQKPSFDSHQDIVLLIIFLPKLQAIHKKTIDVGTAKQIPLVNYSTYTNSLEKSRRDMRNNFKEVKKFR